MYAEESYLPLSGLQHMIFCDRQAALIHVEGVWVDNSLTVEGTHLHRVVDAGRSTNRNGLRLSRGLRLASQRLGLSGRADVVEFHEVEETGAWRPVPVEYKRGRPKEHRADEVQLCAQAMCLEEYFAVPVAHGELFYGETRRRLAVRFDDALRRLTEDTAHRFHALVRDGVTPVRFREKKCQRCSLVEVCLPPRRRALSAAAYLARAMGTELQSEA